MSKSYVKELEQVYAALFRDAVYAYPDLRDEFGKDQAHLEECVRTRGLPVFLDDLPKAGKIFDRSLGKGKYLRKGGPLTKRVSNTVKFPQFLRGLHGLVFEHTGCLKGEPDVQAIAILRQFYYCAKKCKVPCTDRHVAKAIDLFVDLDESLPEPSWFWGDMSGARNYLDRRRICRFNDEVTFEYWPTAQRWVDNQIRSGAGCQLADKSSVGETPQEVVVDGAKVRLPFDWEEHLALLELADTIFRELTLTLGTYDPEEWDFKHGPGAVSDAMASDSKYELLATRWSERLEQEYPVARFGFPNYAAWVRLVERLPDWAQAEFPPSCPSKLVDVPKDWDKPRLIAAEPLANMWCQQNIRHFMYSRVARTWLGGMIQFTDQTLNQALALVASLKQRDPDGSDDLATVDLSEASDRITCPVVEAAFYANEGLLAALAATRTQEVELPDGSIHRLNKFSTMGNACTFPVESLVFLGVALTAFCWQKGLPPSGKTWHLARGKVAVFGDDIIVPSDCREVLEWLLACIHMRVNSDKSFWTGRFRESCGVDAFDGINVTPAYWQGPFEKEPESWVSSVQVSNNFYSRGYIETARRVARDPNKWIKIPLVHPNSGVIGLHDRTFTSAINTSRVRWNDKRQVHETKVPIAIAKGNRRNQDGDASLLQYFTEKPVAGLTDWRAGVSERPVLKLEHRWVPLSDLGEAPPLVR
jgi:hypothetical protein